MSEKNSYEVGFGSDAVKNPQRIVFITKKTSAKVKGAQPRQLMSYPHVVLREIIAFEIFTVALVVVALFWDAPLEQLANPLLTPNPAKAPWYFLGLQELLHYLPPVVAGVLIPTLVIVALVVIPYFDVNIKGEPLWASNRRRRLMAFMGGVAVLLIVFGIHEAFDVVVPTVAFAALALAAYFAPPQGGRLMRYLRARPLSWWIMSWFIAVSLTLTLVGTFFRGPGWSLVWPWR
jgi:quinol-cytochrome oxidoreductase complex cytochrome b subunit